MQEQIEFGPNPQTAEALSRFWAEKELELWGGKLFLEAMSRADLNGSTWASGRRRPI